jgi:hypothetical protein
MRSRFASFFIVLLALASFALAGKAPTAHLDFEVIRDYNGKPVRNAAVVMHPVEANGKQSRGGMELKTDDEGKTNFDGVPYGPLRIQVLAPGFQTFGQDYDINQPSMSITVRLKRPQDQYTVYGDKKSDSPKDDNKKDDGPPPPDSKPQ